MVAKAAILCGGQGVRLRPLTNYFQKTMIPIGPGRRPLLEYIVKLMVHHDVRDIVMLCGYRAAEIENYFGDGSRFGARISYSRDAEGVKGSGQALMRAVENGTMGEFDDLIVYYGDVLSSLDLGELLRQKEEAKADVALVLSKNYVIPVGVANVNDGRVVSFHEKPNLDLNVTMGCVAFSKACFPVLKEMTMDGQPTDIMTHFIPRVIETGLKVVPFYLDGFWFDVGTTEAYERLDQVRLDEELAFLGASTPLT